MKMTREKMMIRCAHCKGRHDTVAEVRACANGTNVAVKLATLSKPTEPRILTREKVTEPGMYRVGDTVYLVVQNKAKTQLYARRLVKVMKGGQVHKMSFVFDKGAIYRIDARDRMTVAQVEEIGRTTGFCMVCLRELKIQKSIQAGIGPVCAKKV